MSGATTGIIFRSGTTTCDTNSVFPVSGIGGTASAKSIIDSFLYYSASCATCAINWHNI